MTTRWLLPLVLPTLLAAQGARIAYERDWYPSDSGAAREEGGLGCRVVDDLTGAPIAGAELLLVPESTTPLPGRYPVTRRATGDADGFVRVRVDDIDQQWSWLVLRAPGHGPAMAMHAPPTPVWRLARGQDVPVLVQDVFGRALPGAEIDFCGGCGHTAELAHATTDAHGIAILRGIDPRGDFCDLYVRHPEVALGHDWLRWHPGDAAFVWRGVPSPAWSGVLLDDAGHAMPHVIVGTDQVHRGPWTETSADGSFQLCGGDAGRELIAVLPARRVYFTRPRSFPVTLRVPDDDGSKAQTGIVEGDTSPADLTATVTVEIRKEVAADVSVLAADRAPKHYAADVTSIEVPSSGPFAIRMFPEDDDARTHPFPSAAALPAGSLVLAPYAPTRVTCTAVDATGAPVAVHARLAPCRDSINGALAEIRAPDGALPFPRGEIELFARATGRCLLALLPDSDLRSRIVWLSLPARGDDARIDLGALTLAAAPALTVCDSEGNPLRDDDVCVGFARDGQQSAGDLLEGALDARGGWLGPDLRESDAVVVQRKEEEGITHLPFRTVLAGMGPWTVRLPANELALEVTGARGEHIEFTVFVADRCESGEGRLVLAELPAGKAALFVTTRDHRTARVEIDVPQRGRCEAKVALPLR